MATFTANKFDYETSIFSYPLAITAEVTSNPFGNDPQDEFGAFPVAVLTPRGQTDEAQLRIIADKVPMAQDLDLIAIPPPQEWIEEQSWTLPAE